MASILEFRRPEFSSRLGARVSAGGSDTADIVLFPGVRYERWSEEQPAPPQRTRRARRRDSLDLDD
jgi:hypothetical protein